MALVNGATYRLQSRADSSRSLNVYGTKPASLANVCLFRNDNNDICQQWVYKKSGTREYFVCKGNQNLALDLYTGSSSTNNVKNYNAHAYAPSETSYVKVDDTISGGYIRIKLDYNGNYLTANPGSDGSSNGKDTSAGGNVYFYSGTVTNQKQHWKPIRLDSGTPDPGEEITVTGMPAGIYTGNTEYFHPASGMVNGTWSQNGGTTKANAVKEFYKKVFKASSAPDSLCLYNLFGAAYSKGTGYEGQYHSGIDMFSDGSSKIYSAHTGEVTAVGGTYGIVAIYDKNKDVTYLYLHMNTANTDAVVGQTIYKGDFLGVQSNVGLGGNGGQHLHIEVRKGKKAVPAGLPTINEALTSISPYNYL